MNSGEVTLRLLAIHGGRPARDAFLSYGQQWLDEADIAAVVKVLRGSYITQGPAVEAFEDAVARYVGAVYAVAFSSGTAALHAAYFAAGVGYGDEVVTTPITFAATANAALFLGGRPRFSDIDNRTYNLEPSLIESQITERTKLLVPVDFAGQPAEMDRIMEVAACRNVVVVEDAAHSLGAVYKERKVGSLAHMTTFSFHPVKPITTGEGGMVVTNSPVYAERLRLFCSHGIRRTGGDEPWHYQMHVLGYNYRMNDMQAALGLSQLRHLDSFLERRRQIAQRYTQAFAEMEGVAPPYQLPETESGWHLYMLRLDLERFRVGRKEIFHALRAENIGVHVHYIPVYWHPYYQDLGYERGLCPVAEKWYEEVLTLPLFPKMTDGDVESVITAVEKVLDCWRR